MLKGAKDLWILKIYKFVYVDLNYLKKLHEIDNEVFYSEKRNYERKPFLGILVNVDGKEFAIPFTSAKAKHIKYRDETEYNYRIFEIIDIRNNYVGENDILIDVTDTFYLRSKNI